MQKCLRSFSGPTFLVRDLDRSIEELWRKKESFGKIMLFFKHVLTSIEAFLMLLVESSSPYGNFTSKVPIEKNMFEVEIGRKANAQT